MAFPRQTQMVVVQSSPHRSSSETVDVSCHGVACRLAASLGMAVKVVLRG